MPRPEEELVDLLKKHGVDFTASLPCEKIKTLLEMVGQSFYHVPLTREEEGVGICAGAALSRKHPAMFVQSSGIGNMINALLSLTQFYELPLALFVSQRGIYKEKIEAQSPMGRRLPAILAGAGITFSEITNSRDFTKMDKELTEVYDRSTIHAFLLSPEIWEGSECGLPGPAYSVNECELASAERADRGSKEEQADRHPASAMQDKTKNALTPRLTRYDIIKSISPYLVGKAVVSNLGWPSKELYDIKHQPSNFYMLGSMGMATPIGLGIALTSSKEVIVIDGDGSLLMNPGTLGTAAYTAPKNLTIIAIDNSAYGSTGNQPTLTGASVDLEVVARGFGFKKTIKVCNAEQINDAMKKPQEGPTFVHVLAIPGNKDVSNIPLHHLDVKKKVEDFLKG